MSPQRFLRHLFAFRLSHQSTLRPLRRLTISASSLPLLIHAFYILLLAQALPVLPQWPSLIQRGHTDYLWPLQWAYPLPSQPLILTILTLHLIGSLAAAWFPQYTIARTLAFLGIFLFVAWNNSFGKVGHSTHLYVLIAFLWIFIPPSLWSPRPNRKTLLTTLDLIQAARLLILITYSLAGLSKLIGGLYQLLIGQPSIFNIDAMSRHIADRLLDTGSQSLLGHTLIQLPLPGFILLWITIYLQLFAPIIYFRPLLALPWTVALCLFHIASYFAITIHFPHNILLLTLLFILFPPHSQLPPIPITQRLKLLPLIGHLIPTTLNRK